MKTKKTKRKLPPQPRRLNKNSVVTLPCSHTKRRLTLRLGPWDLERDCPSPEAWREHGRILGEWEAANRMVSAVRRVGESEGPRAHIQTVEDLLVAYEAQQLSKHHQWILAGLKPLLVKRYGTCRLEDFAPLSLLALRDEWAKDEGKAPALRDPVAKNKTKKPEDKPAVKVTQQTIQRRSRMVVRMFEHASIMGWIGPDLPARLRLLPPTQQGRKNPGVQAVPRRTVEDTLPHLVPVVADMVRLQLATGMRPQEVCLLTPSQVIKRKDGRWHYVPAKFKTDYIEGRTDVIPLGPKARAVLRPYMDRPADTPCFSPREAHQQATLARMNESKRQEWLDDQPLGRIGKIHGRVPGDQYTTDSYRRCITRACERAGIRRWAPNQIRHLVSTELRRELDADTASTVLRHSSVELTDRVYAERNLQKASDAMERFG